MQDIVQDGKQRMQYQTARARVRQTPKETVHCILTDRCNQPIGHLEHVVDYVQFNQLLAAYRMIDNRRIREDQRRPGCHCSQQY